MSMSTLETAASNLSTASDCQVTDRRDLTLWMPLLRIQLTLSAEWLEDGQLWAVAKASTFRPNSLSKGHWAPRCCLQLHLAPCGPRAGQPSPASRSEQTTAVRSSSICFPFAGGWAVHTRCFRCCCHTHIDMISSTRRWLCLPVVPRWVSADGGVLPRATFAIRPGQASPSSRKRH